MLKGHVHSIETFGTVDGPGIRFVVFFQGCMLKCQYCHNPDTWDLEGGVEYTVTELLDEYDKYRNFLKGGGITVTGGEALLQMNFVTELFKEAKARNIHTCLDTSGATFRKGLAANVRKMQKLMDNTDLVLLDLKHIDDAKHRELTGITNKNILDFAVWLSESGVAVWIRHVVIPGITLDDSSLYRLGRFIGKLDNVERIELLPYHVMGVNKWEALGWKYPLEGIEPPKAEEFSRAQQIVIKGVKDQHLMLKKQNTLKKNNIHLE
ncbi:pyruvate formate lyase activating enzyme [Erysipelotrichaceae bacterium]|nr:pyruvate formate lyase activating enzyme [Erysipelotrichaceae bacterium]